MVWCWFLFVIVEDDKIIGKGETYVNRDKTNIRL